MMNCRHCNKTLRFSFANLGFSPPSNAFLNNSDLYSSEKYYPLSIRVCDECWLVQTEDYTVASELFDNEYVYHSSASSSWLEHAKQYVENITRVLNLNHNSFVIEIASNDGYLLKNFLEREIPCIGIEPTENTALISERLGINVLKLFFSEKLGKQLANNGQSADLIIGNNVYAHVPDINDFTRGLKAALKRGGVITLEFPHLLNMIKNNQFDTIYHEHFSYLSLGVVSRIFSSYGLKIYDVEEIPTHGGSLRIYGCHENELKKNSPRVARILSEENKYKLNSIEGYGKFQIQAEKAKNDLLEFLIQQKKMGKKVVAYGAAAKGSTLLNYAGIKPDLIPYVVDISKSKQGKYMPGSHIPVMPLDVLKDDNPDYILILPWNIAVEIIDQNLKMLNKGAKFFSAIPELKFYET